MKRIIFFCLWLFFSNAIALAGEADVIEVEVNRDKKNSYSFSVTVAHKDSGWDHYANKWDIIDEDGSVLGTRVLHHPHVNEQPFTRSLSGVAIPDQVKIVTIRAHDSVHNYGGKVMTVELPAGK